jgi:outer membrane protein W
MSKIVRAVLGIVALYAVYVPTAGAQNKSTMTFGIMAGANYAKVSQDPEQTDVSFDYTTGLLAGAFLGIRVNDVFSIEPQVLYSVKGTKLEGTGSNSSITGSIKLNYVEVPLLGKFWIPMSNSQVRPFVFAGPEFAYLISCRAKGTAFGTTVSDDCDQTDLKVKSTDVGATVGGGLEFMAGRQSVRVDGRYTHGLTDINDDSTDPTKAKNRAFAVTVGVGFPLPK